MGGDLRHGITGGNQTISEDKPLKFQALSFFYQKKENIKADDNRVDNRKVPGLDGIAQGYHGAPSMIIRLLVVPWAASREPGFVVGLHYGVQSLL
jgi:hypothetical protein